MELTSSKFSQLEQSCCRKIQISAYTDQEWKVYLFCRLWTLLASQGVPISQQSWKGSVRRDDQTSPEQCRYSTIQVRRILHIFTLFNFLLTLLAASVSSRCRVEVQNCFCLYRARPIKHAIANESKVSLYLHWGSYIPKCFNKHEHKSNFIHASFITMKIGIAATDSFQEINCNSAQIYQRFKYFSNDFHY